MDFEVQPGHTEVIYGNLIFKRNNDFFLMVQIILAGFNVTIIFLKTW